MSTFLEANDFAGKTVVPFATNGGWPGHALEDIEKACKGADFAPGLAVKEVAPVPSTAFVTSAKRPHNSRLSTAKLQQAFGLTLPAWQQGVNRMLAEIA